MICAPVRLVGMVCSVHRRAAISQIDSPSDTITTSNDKGAGAILEFTEDQGGRPMKLQWISAAILSAAVATGCGDKGQQNDQNSDQTALAPAGDTSGVDRQAVSPDTDNSAAQPDSSGTRATAGTRVNPSRPAATPRNDAAPRAEARRDVAPPARVVREVTVPIGTSLPLELMTALSSETAQVEAPVQARLRRAVEIGGHTAIPEGTVLSGSVTDVARAGRVQGRSRLALRFDSATVNGVREHLSTEPITFEGEATKKEDATKIGVGAGIGAAIGAIAGGGGGAAKGAAIGGAAGTGAVLATRGKEVELAAGTDLTATTANAVTVEAR